MNESMKKGLALVTMTALLGLGAGCGEPVEDRPAPTEENPSFDDGDYPLSGYEETVEDLKDPSGAEAERYDLKFDLTLPSKYEDLKEFQSPVRNQASRGVCSIFSTVGLMESLYIMEGTITEPDFSEQFLQYSAKLEAGHFPKSGGSSGRSNLDALHRFGVVTEDVLPYEGKGWGTTQDAACTGDDRPTICHTNGVPSDDILNSPRYRLPRSKYVSVYPDSLKTYMFKNKTPVIIGVDFMYQSWNHGGSKFTVNQDNKLMGAVPFPSPGDKESSLENRAGHSILVVGWDDEAKFPRLDADGTPLKDAAGNEIYEEGFYIIKNSWGTSGTWGSRHPWGTGYGYISYRYVQEFGNAVSAQMPDESHFPEIKTLVDADGDGVGDDVDNCPQTSNPSQKDVDEDGVGDTCDNCVAVSNPDQVNTDGDTLGDACDECPEGVCSDSASYTNDEGVDIPDNDDEGITSLIDVDVEGAITKLTLDVDITHSWAGDLDILLMAPDGEFVIVKEAGDDDSNDVIESFVIEDFNGLAAKGSWSLIVSDGAARDTGRLQSWGLSFETE